MAQIVKELMVIAAEPAAAAVAGVVGAAADGNLSGADLLIFIKTNFSVKVTAMGLCNLQCAMQCNGNAMGPPNPAEAV